MIIPLEEGITAEVTRTPADNRMEETTFSLPAYEFKTPEGYLPAGYEAEIVKAAHKTVTGVIGAFLDAIAKEAEKKFLRQSVGIEDGTARQISGPNDKEG